MKANNSSFYDHMPDISNLTDISTVSGITGHHMSMDLEYVIGQPVQLIVKGIPCTNEVDLIINSTKDGIKKILKILDAGCIAIAGHDTECGNEKNNESIKFEE